jgi:hypothetical protein
MVLAGGAVAVSACSSQSSGSAFNPGAPDATTDAQRDAGIDTGVVGGGCCNANGDPCCEFMYCDAAISSQCVQEMACQADGGVWNLDYPESCSFGDGGAPDGGEAGVAGDGAPGDAEDDGGDGGGDH